MKKIICLVITITTAFTLAACGDNSSVPENSDYTVDAPATDSAVFEENNAALYNTSDNNENSVINPYLSIIGRRINPNYEEEEYYVWDEVYYTYDLVTNELREICVLPHFSGYTAGVVSLWDNAVYYSKREGERTNDRICKYDIKSGEENFIENENWSYNDFTLINSNTLLLIALTPEHTTTPALFSLDSGTFTYMANVNGEDFGLYTSGGQLMDYNYLFDTFPWLYFRLSDRYSDGYTGHEEAIDYNFTMVSTNLKKSDSFTEQFMAAHQIGFLTQVSENVVLVQSTETIWDESTLTFDDDGTITGGGFVYADTYYHLTFDGENTSFIEIDNPFHRALKVVQALTFDGGETYCCLGYYFMNNYEYEGVFIYDCETDEITPILLTDDRTNSIANFRAVG